MASTGTGTTSAMSSGGLPTPSVTTEEWTFSHAIKTVTTS